MKRLVIRQCRCFIIRVNCVFVVAIDLIIIQLKTGAVARYAEALSQRFLSRLVLTLGKRHRLVQHQMFDCVQRRGVIQLQTQSETMCATINCASEN